MGKKEGRIPRKVGRKEGYQGRKDVRISRILTILEGRKEGRKEKEGRKKEVRKEGRKDVYHGRKEGWIPTKDGRKEGYQIRTDIKEERKDIKEERKDTHTHIYKFIICKEIKDTYHPGEQRI